MERQSITARVIIQMKGAPKKHIEDTLKLYIDRIKEEKNDIEVLSEDTEKAKKDGDMYNVFTELEIKTKDSAGLVWFCFDYMPASVEIVDPDVIHYDSHEFTGFINDLQGKLHEVDMIIKNLSAENQVIKKNGLTLLKNIIMLNLKFQPTDLDTLAVNAGVPVQNIQKLLDAMEKDRKVKKEEGLYKLA